MSRRHCDLCGLSAKFGSSGTDGGQMDGGEMKEPSAIAVAAMLGWVADSGNNRI
jgi:hypothetical protein